MNRKQAAWAGGATLLAAAVLFFGDRERTLPPARVPGDTLELPPGAENRQGPALQADSPGASNGGSEQVPTIVGASSEGALAAASVSSASIEGSESSDGQAIESSSGEQRAADLVRDMADAAYERIGENFIDYLTTSGLSRADSERIARQAMHDGSRCAIDALRVEAAAQSVSFDDVLWAVAAGVYQSDGPFLSAVIDTDAVRLREVPCLLNVFQQAGLPISVVEQLVR